MKVEGHAGFANVGGLRLVLLVLPMVLLMLVLLIVHGLRPAFVKVLLLAPKNIKFWFKNTIQTTNFGGVLPSFALKRTRNGVASLPFKCVARDLETKAATAAIMRSSHLMRMHLRISLPRMLEVMRLVHYKFSILHYFTLLDFLVSSLLFVSANVIVL